MEEPRFIEALDFAVLLRGQASVGAKVMALTLTQPMPTVKTASESRPANPLSTPSPAMPEIDPSWFELFEKLLSENTPTDAAHDPSHIHRVVANATQLARTEGADPCVVLPAAWLHDCVIVPKSSPDRKLASRLAARQAVEWLEAHAWPHGRLNDIAHAIEAHSFSAGIAPLTLEAKVVQDADRLDALGAVGLARTLMLGGEMKREFYDPWDPFCDARPPDDSRFTLDHLFSKLFTLEGTMQTASGKKEAAQRTAFLQDFLDHLRREMGSIS